LRKTVEVPHKTVVILFKEEKEGKESDANLKTKREEGK